MARLISRALFARQCGVSKPAITNACKKQLAAACVGNLIDVDHEAARAYMAAKNVRLGEMLGPARAPTAPAKAGRAAAAKPTRIRKGHTPARPSPPAVRRSPVAPDGQSSSPDGSDDDIAQLAAQLKPLLDHRFGTHTMLKEWLESLKNIEAIREKRLKNAATEGDLISRDLVKTHVFGAFESTFKRLLADSPKTITSKIFNLARAGGSAEEGERIMRDELGSQLKPLKAALVRNLRKRRVDAKASSDGDG